MGIRRMAINCSENFRKPLGNIAIICKTNTLYKLVNSTSDMHLDITDTKTGQILYSNMAPDSLAPGFVCLRIHIEFKIALRIFTGILKISNQKPFHIRRKIVNNACRRIFIPEHHDYFYFSKVFKKHCSYSPKEYRRQFYNIKESDS